MDKVKTTFKTIKDNSLIVLIIIFLIYSAVTIEYAPSGNIELQYQYIAVSVMGVIVILSTIKKKKKMLESRLDLCVLLFTMTTALPIIFNKAVCVNDALYVFNQYVILLEFFMIVKKLFEKQTKSKNILINVISLLTIILIFIGIDKMTINILQNKNTSFTRLESLFFSPNAFATLIGGTIFLVFGQLFNTNKAGLKHVYIVELTILMLGLILTYSRIMYAVFALSLVIYYICNKDVKVKKQILSISIILIVLGLLYSKLYSETLLSEEYYKVWIGLLINIILAIILCEVSTKIINKIQINIKRIIIFAFLFSGVIIIYFFSVKNISEPLVVFNSTTSYSKVEKTIYGANKKETYVLNFDIEARGTSTYKIIVEQRDKYMDYVVGTDIIFEEYMGTKEIEIVTDELTEVINIIFEAENINEDSYLKINKVLLNNKEVILNYKYLPTNIMERFSSIGTNSKNLWERETFYKDALAIIKKDGNWILGIGGNGWKYKYLEEQSYSYTSANVHNYPLQILLEFGIIGFGIFIIIVIILIKKLVLAKGENKTITPSVICAMLCMLLHSCFDYGMAFFYILVIMYLGLAIVDEKKEEKNEIKGKIANCVICVIAIISFLYNISYGMYVVNNTIIQKKEKNKREEIYQIISNIYPVDIEARKNVINSTENRKKRIENYQYLFDKEAYYIAEYDFLSANIISYISDCLNEYEDINNLIKIREYFYKTKNIKKYSFQYQKNRLYQIITFGDMVLNYNKTKKSEELENLGINIYIDAKNELESKRTYMLDYEKARFHKSEIDKYQQEIEKIQDSLDERINR